MCDSDQPAAPTADAGVTDAAYAQANIGNEYLAFAKNQFQENEVTKANANKTLQEASDTFKSWSREDRARYEDVFVPLQDAYIKTANEYGSQENQDLAAAKARADVQSNADLQKASSERNLESMGVRPDSGKFTGIDRAIGINTALGSVDAQNKARETVRTTGMALKRDAINLGTGLPQQALTEGQASTAAGTQQIANNINSQSIMQNGVSAAMAGEAGKASTLNTTYKTDADVYKTTSAAASAEAAGKNKLIGTVLGLGASALPGGASGALRGGLGLLSGAQRPATA